jgi:hypothetical protein
MPTDIERFYIAQGYALPDGLDWDRVAELRARWGVRPIFVPIACGGGCLGWGVPFVDGRPLSHPPNAEFWPSPDPARRCDGSGDPRGPAAAPAREGP